MALLLPNCPAMVAYLFGILRVGAAAVPLNPALTGPEIAFILDKSWARAIVTTGELIGKLHHEEARHPARHVVVIDPKQRLELDSSLGRIEPVGGVAQTAFVIFTGGTTGQPKGVPLTHGNVLANTAQVAERTGLTPADRVLHIMPMFHTNGLMNNTILPLRAGASIVLRPRFDSEEFWDVVARFRPTYFTAVPTVFARLVDAWDDSADTSSLRFVRSGAAPMSPVLQREVEERLGVPVVVSYGLSEATCTCTMNPAGWDRRTGSVGTALADEGVTIVDDSGHARCAGDVGEIVVCGPNVMAGYHDAPEATRDALRNGRLHTGDLGYLDEDGFLFLTDRKKDLIIRGGENISPREIEEALLAHPSIAEAAVVGTPDREWGEEVAAFVVLKADTTFDAEDLRGFCRDRLARFKVPRRIEVVATLPLTAVGKVDKARLRRQCASKRAS